ncbi:GH18007 [Drosophila grimshawi]|uniref:GH18007 n=1 Tax=Drosophila grimshawi TaxID=7222 RepID=B4K1B4_DROGR|nr:GH18007 [Drosophila grimshawi]
MSNDPTDNTALTPAHFLIGETLTAPPDVNSDRNEKYLLKRWELVSGLKQGFWKQWSQEYLQELQARHKWKAVNPNIKEGMLVLVKEDNIPVMSWPMGRIVHTYPGQDNHVRVVDGQTASGINKRPVTRLAPLFPEDMAKKRPIKETEDTDKNDAPPVQRKRLMSPTITPSVLILLFMLPLVLTNSVSVTRFNTKPGIYYENWNNEECSIRLDHGNIL